jgi:hypothetical protein
MNYLKLHFKEKLLLINKKHIIRIRSSYETNGGSSIDFLGGGKQEVDESVQQLKEMIDV